MNVKTVFIAIVAVITWSLGVAVVAEDIRIDLSALVSSTGGNWNNVSNLTGLTSNLKDFATGIATSVSINGTGSPWSDFFGDDSGTFPNRDWLIQPATVDGAGLQTGLTGTYLVAGLTAPAYRVEIVTARTSHNYLNSITVNGALASRTSLGTPVNTPWGSANDGLTPGNWLIWDNVVPLGGGFSIRDQAAPSTLGMINALRILGVPEPSTFIFAVVALLAACGRRHSRA